MLGIAMREQGDCTVWWWPAMLRVRRGAVAGRNTGVSPLPLRLRSGFGRGDGRIGGESGCGAGLEAVEACGGWIASYGWSAIVAAGEIVPESIETNGISHLTLDP